MITKIDTNSLLYPKKLKKIKNPPKNLFLNGNIKLLNSKSIAIIGSRACTQNGKKLAIKFTKELVAQGLTIISGMAKRNRYYSS